MALRGYAGDGTEMTFEGSLRIVRELDGVERVCLRFEVMCLE